MFNVCNRRGHSQRKLNIDGKPFKFYNVNQKQGWNMYTTIQTINYTIEGAHNYTSLKFISEILDNLRWGAMRKGISILLIFLASFFQMLFLNL